MSIRIAQTARRIGDVATGAAARSEETRLCTPKRLSIIGLLLASQALAGCSLVTDLAVATGETALFAADLLTFGAVSALTGSDDKDWAVSPSTSSSFYGGVASSYSSQVAAANTSTKSYVPRTSTSTASPSTPAPAAKRSYSARALAHCVSWDHHRNGIASFVHNRCSEKLAVSFLPASGLGAGSWGLLLVGAGSKQSTNKMSGDPTTLVCRYGDALNKQSAVCAPL